MGIRGEFFFISDIFYNIFTLFEFTQTDIS